MSAHGPSAWMDQPLPGTLHVAGQEELRNKVLPQTGSPRHQSLVLNLFVPNLTLHNAYMVFLVHASATTLWSPRHKNNLPELHPTLTGELKQPQQQRMRNPIPAEQAAVEIQASQRMKTYLVERGSPFKRGVSSCQLGGACRIPAATFQAAQRPSEAFW